MQNFTLHKNLSSSNINYPYLLNIQNKLLDSLRSRVVIPLIKKNYIKENIKILNPEIEINEEKYVFLVQQITTVPNDILGTELENIEIDRVIILSAIDFLITGF